MLRKDVNDPGDDCPVETYDSDEEFTVVSEPFESNLQAVRSWDGQNFSMADIEETEADLGACFDVIDNFRFSRVSPTGTIERFQVIGASHKIADLGTNSLGFNMARYQLPDVYYVSESGHMTSFGGTIDAVCVSQKWQLRLGPVGLQVNVMAYRTFNYQGPMRISIINGGGAPASGWAYYSPGQSFASGNTGGWDAALDAYLADGSCTAHWDIFVDGHLVCHDGNRVNQT